MGWVDAERKGRPVCVAEVEAGEQEQDQHVSKHRTEEFGAQVTQTQT